jgi:hypothetical protein
MPAPEGSRPTPGAAPGEAALPGDWPVVKVVASQVEATFHPILDQRRWVLWQQRPNRKDPAKRDKVPVVATGRRSGASSTDPATWRTWPCAQRHLEESDVAGAGIMLGRLDDGRWLVGVDLDLALSPITGRVEPWAQAVVERCATYAEVSPSGAGIKLFGYARALPVSLLTEDASGRPLPQGARRHAIGRTGSAWHRRLRAQDARAGSLRRAALLHRHGPQARRCPRPAR